jgi:hypothetical protein
VVEVVLEEEEGVVLQEVKVLQKSLSNHIVMLVSLLPVEKKICSAQRIW